MSFFRTLQVHGPQSAIREGVQDPDNIGLPESTADEAELSLTQICSAKEVARVSCSLPLLQEYVGPEETQLQLREQKQGLERLYNIRIQKTKQWETMKVLERRLLEIVIPEVGVLAEDSIEVG